MGRIDVAQELMRELIDLLRRAPKNQRPYILQSYILEFGPIPNQYDSEIREILAAD